MLLGVFELMLVGRKSLDCGFSDGVGEAFQQTRVEVAQSCFNIGSIHNTLRDAKCPFQNKVSY